ncbi:unnamed protein product [Umbelopsis ramanniana]
MLNQHVSITVKIRSSVGSTFELQIEPDGLTVGDLKQLLTDHIAGATAADLRLVYSGRILKDPDTLSTYDIREGHVIHVVKSGSSQAQGPTSPPSTAQAPTSPPSTQQSRSPPPNPLSAGGLGGFGGLGGNMPDPEVMRGMMESPMMQSIMNNPGTNG